VIAVARLPAALSRPAISGNTVVYSTATASGGWITAVDLANNRSRQIRVSHESQLLNPSLLGTALVYVESARCSQRLVLGYLRVPVVRTLLTFAPVAGADVGHEPEHTAQGSRTPCGRRPLQGARSLLWTTALAPDRAFVTVLDARTGRPTIEAVAR
jgi:hypothetical protein